MSKRRSSESHWSNAKVWTCPNLRQCPNGAAVRTRAASRAKFRTLVNGYRDIDNPSER